MKHNLNAHRWCSNKSTGYLNAVVGVFFAFCVRMALQPQIEEALPLFFFQINTIVIAFFYGYAASLFTILISIPLAFFFFVPPFDSFDTPTAQDSFVFGSYILIACIAVGVVEWLQRERYKAILISRVSNSNFQMLSQASAHLKKDRDSSQKPSF